MEFHPDQAQPNDYVRYPGKLDHTSCIGKEYFKTQNLVFEARSEKLLIQDTRNTLDECIIKLRSPQIGLTFDTNSFRGMTI